MDNVLTSATNYQANAGGNTTYVGRKVLLRRAGVEETRTVVSEIAGTTTTRILTVHEAWDTAPVSGDNVDFAYQLDDIENGGAGGGVTFNTSSGIYEFSNDLHIGQGTNFAFLQLTFGEVAEITDTKSSTVYGLDILNNGRFDCGYVSGGIPIAGGIISGINNSASEPWIRWLSGAQGEINDTVLNAALNTLEFTVDDSATSNVIFRGCTIFRGTEEARLFDTELYNVSFYGNETANEYLRVDAGTIWEGGVVANTAGLDSTSGDTSTETLTVRDLLWTGNSKYISINSNKTWDVINPVWGVTVHGDLTWTTTTSNVVNEKYSLDVTVAQPDGTAIASPRVFVYRGLIDAAINEALDIDVTGDSNGLVNSSWIYRKYETNSNTDTYTDHALRVYKYGKTPFVAALSDNTLFDGAITLIDDSQITEATQATAITNGSGIAVTKHTTGETDTRPLKVLKYDAGVGTVPTVAETVTQGTATGKVVEYIGDAVSGTIVLENWNGTEFTDNQNITGATFDATTDTTGFYQEYTWLVDCTTKNLTVVYDYLAGKMAEGTLDAIFDQAHEWGADEQAQLLYDGGETYTTERNISKTEGVWIANKGTGTIAYLTSDAGTQYIPPVQYTFTLTNLDIGSTVHIYADEGDFQSDTLLASTSNSGSTLAYNYIYATDQDIYSVYISDTDLIQRIFSTLSNADQSVAVPDSVDRVYLNP